jgi:hypothetical protein
MQFVEIDAIYTVRQMHYRIAVSLIAGVEKPLDVAHVVYGKAWFCCDGK